MSGPRSRMALLIGMAMLTMSLGRAAWHLGAGPVRRRPAARISCCACHATHTQFQGGEWHEIHAAKTVAGTVTAAMTRPREELATSAWCDIPEDTYTSCLPVT
jgi:hypothetical protein